MTTTAVTVVDDAFLSPSTHASIVASVHTSTNLPNINNNITNTATISRQQQQQQHNTTTWWISFWIRPRAIYTFVFCWLAATNGRFLTLLLQHNGGSDDDGSSHHIQLLPTSTIGQLLGAQALLSIPASAVCGYCADQLEQYYPNMGRMVVLAMGIVLGTITLLGHTLNKFAVVVDNENKYDDDSTGNMSSTTNTVIAWFLFLRLLTAVSVSMVLPVLDGLCLDYLHQTNQAREEFGKERLFGAISWAVTNVGIALALDRFGFTVLYLVSGVSAVVVVITLLLYSRHYQKQTLDPNLHHHHHHHHPMKRHTSDIPDTTTMREIDDETISKKEIFHRLLSGDIHLQAKNYHGNYYGCAFILASTLLSAGQIIVDALVFLYFEELGSSYTVMGWTVALTVSFEIPIFHIAGQLLDRFGCTKLLQMAMFCYMTRVVGYTLIPTGHASYALLLEPLHGITYACSATAAVEFVARLMPPQQQSTGQGLVNAVRQIGAVIGLVVGSWAEDTVGPHILYRTAAAMVLIGSLLLGCCALRTDTFVHQRVPRNDNCDLEMIITDKKTMHHEKKAEEAISG